MIPIAGPWITKAEIDLVSEAAAHGWYKKSSYYQEYFENTMSEYLGVKHAIALPSCTAAIHLALLALEIGQGDRVTVPDITWIASAAPVKYVNADIDFADIQHDTWCIDSSQSNIMQDNTKAIIAVDLYGSMPNLNSLRTITESNNIALIEDAAEAIGSTYYGKKAGSIGDIGVFSFHGTKTITTGEGGMLVTNNKNIHEKALYYSNHCRGQDDHPFRNKEVGYKYKMSAMQAAMGLAQLRRIEELIEKKRQIFSWYHEHLSELEDIQLNSEPDNTYNSYWMVTMILPADSTMNKEQLIAELKKNNIDSRPFFYPLSSLPAFNDYPPALLAQKRNRVSYEISPFGINLPSALTLTRDQVKYVCATIKSILT